MPRYRMLKPPPDVLVYRNGRLLLSDVEGLYNAWSWQAKKEGAGYSVVVLLRAPNPMNLEKQRQEGFDVADGSPSHKIMRALETRGYAEHIG